VKTGSCNPTVMGVIAAQVNMPSCKFSNPPNNGVIPALTTFDITMNIQGVRPYFLPGAVARTHHRCYLHNSS
jgi:hypothetical protein